MQRLLTAILILILLIDATPVAMAQDGGWYTSSSYNFKIKPPADWAMFGKQDKSSGEITEHVMFMSPPDEDGYQRAMWVASSPYTYQSAADLKRQFDTELADFKKELTRDISRAGLTGVTVNPLSADIDREKDALDIVCEVDTDNVTLQFLQHVTFARGRRYNVVFLTYATDYAAEEPGFRRCLETFEIDAPFIDISRLGGAGKLALGLLVAGVLLGLRWFLTGDSPVSVSVQTVNTTVVTPLSEREIPGNEDHSYSGNYKARSAPPPTIPKLGSDKPDAPGGDLFPRG